MRGFGEIAVICLAALGLAAAPTPTKDKELVNGMAAKVAGQVITVQDARFFLALQRFKDGKDPMAPEGPGELRTAVQRMLLEEMVFSELRSLKFEGGARTEAEKALAGRKRPPASKSWAQMLKTYGKSEGAAIDLVWRSLQVEKFIQRRVDTMTPIVTATEVERFIRQKSPDKRMSEEELEKLRPGAAQELKKELMRKELEEWIVLLKRKYAVTNYLES